LNGVAASMDKIARVTRTLGEILTTKELLLEYGGKFEIFMLQWKLHFIDYFIFILFGNSHLFFSSYCSRLSASTEAITTLWESYHKEKYCIAAVVEPEQYKELKARWEQYPIFLVPCMLVSEFFFQVLPFCVVWLLLLFLG
jgi:hypothetical protein